MVKRTILFLCGAIFISVAQGDTFHLPTANDNLFKGKEEQFFVGTTGHPWTSGRFGCVRSGGGQMHEGLDIRSIKRDRKGEPTDPILATAAGTVAYVNRKSGLSNYGNYVVLKHSIDGLEVYSLYAHLSEVRAGLKAGDKVRAEQEIATMGRTSNTRERISKERAHVHFELNFLVNDRFSAWHKRNYPGQRDDHGMWNGQNMIGLDPRTTLLADHKFEGRFNLLGWVQRQPELCRVVLRDQNFSWLKRYAPLIRSNALARKNGVAGYELVLNFNGLPVQVIPRAESEIKSKSKYSLLSVNEAEYNKNPCRRLVTKRNGRWELASNGTRLLDLLTY